MTRRITFLIAFLLTILTCVNAQNRRHQFNPGEFDRQLEQFIIREAQLSPTQASAFFKEYNEMNKQTRRLFNKQKDIRHNKPQSEEACKKAIRDFDNNDIQIKQIQKRYHERFIRLLGASKTYDVMKAEQKFLRQSFRRAAQHR